MEQIQSQEILHTEIINEDDVKMVESMLVKQLTCLGEASSEKIVVELLRERIIQLISDTLDKVHHSPKQLYCYEIIDKVTDLLMTGSESGKEATRCIISTLTEKCVDLAISPTFMFINKIEILKALNMMLESCPVLTKQEILTREGFADKMALLFKAIYEVGDYELQVCIIECLFRLISKSMRKSYLKDIIEDDELYTKFLDIKDNRFEIDCRSFLNNLNQKTDSSSRVYSFPAEMVKIDGKKIYKPVDDGYDTFWIDFNPGSRRIVIFCEPNFLSTQESQNGEQLWETVSVWDQDVGRYQCTVENKMWKVVIELQPGAALVTNKESDGEKHLIIIVVSQIYDLKIALQASFKTAQQHKASSVIHPISILKRPVDSSSKPVSTYNQMTHSQQSQDESLSGRSRPKVSVPLVPMTASTSSVTSNCYQIWQKSHVLQGTHQTEVTTAAMGSGTQDKNSIDIESKEREDVISKEKSAMSQLHQADVASKTCCYKSINNKCLGIHSGTMNDRDKCNEIDKITDSSNKGVGMSGCTQVVKVTVNQNEKLLEDGQATNRSQAKVRPSEKCTDMRKHNLGPRASNACVDMVKDNSPLNVSGDSLSLRRSQRGRKSQSEEMKNDSPKELEKKTSEDIETFAASERGKKGKTSTLRDRKEQHRFDGQQTDLSHVKKSTDKTTTFKTCPQPPKTPPAKILRSGKKVKTPVVSIEPAWKKLSETQKGKNSKTPKCHKTGKEVSGSQHPGVAGMHNDIEDGWNGCDKSKIYDDKVQEPTVSSNFEEKLSQKKKKKNCTSRDIAKSKKVDENVPPVTLGEMMGNHRSNISPGAVSLDDFKAPKSFASLEKSKSKLNSKSIYRKPKSVPENKVGRTEMDEKPAKMNSKSEVKIVTETKNAKKNDTMMLKDFLPSLKEKERSEDVGKMSSTTSLRSSVVEDVSRVKPTGKWPAHEETVEKESKIGVGDIYGNNPQIKSKGTLSFSRKETVSLGEVSSSSSGELYIEIVPSEKVSKECDVIAETQIEKSQPLSVADGLNSYFHSTAHIMNSSDGKLDHFQHGTKLGDSNEIKCHTRNNQSNENCTKPTQGSMINYLSDKSASASEDQQLGSKMESSYIFSKHRKKNNVAQKSGRQQSVKQNEPVDQDNEVTSVSPPDETNVYNELEENHKKSEEKSPCLVSSSNTEEDVSQFKKTSTKKIKEPAGTNKPSRTLRSRNKVISYREANSTDLSLHADGDEDSKQVNSDNTAKSKSSKKEDMKLNSSFQGNHSHLFTPYDEKLKRAQGDKEAMTSLGSHAPRKLLKHNSKKHHSIWTSHKVEKTTTTVSYSEFLNKNSFINNTRENCLSDPYDFEAECEKMSIDLPPIVQFHTSGSTKRKSMLEQSTPKDKVNNTTHGSIQSCYVTKHQSQIKERKTKVKSHKTQEAQQSFQTRKSHSHNNELTGGASSHEKRTGKQNLPRNTKRAYNDGKASSSDSDKSLSKFSLFASQIEKHASDSGGLVFPHLDDSIPCTPYEEVKENSNDETEKKSLVSDVSWLPKSQASTAKNKKKREKTYKRDKSKSCHNVANSDAEGDDGDLESGPLYSSIFHKKKSKEISSGLAVKTPDAKKTANTQRKRKIFSPIQVDITTHQLSSYKDYSNTDDSEEDIHNSPDQKLPSILSCGSRKSSSILGKKVEKSLSFNSDAEHFDYEDYDRNVLLKDDSPDSKKTPINKSKEKRNGKSWNLISADIDHHLQDVIDRLSATTDQDFSSLGISGGQSGPSSSKRPSQSSLKRKYAKILSPSSGNESNESVYAAASSCDEDDNEARPHKFIPRKLFKSDSTSTMLKENEYASQCNLEKLRRQTADETPQNSVKAPLKVTGRQNKTPKATLNITPVSSKRNSCRKLDLSSAQNQIEKLKSNSTKSSFSFDFECYPYPLGSPEKGRSCNNSKSSENLSGMRRDLSLSLPLTISSLSSPLVELDPNLSQDDLDENNIEKLPSPSNLLDSIRKDLATAVSQISGSSSEMSDQLAGIEENSNEVSSNQFGSLRDFIAKKKIKTPSYADSVQGAVKSTCKMIKSSWETEESKRMSAVQKFQAVAKSTCTVMSREIKELNAMEIQASLLWAQQMQRLEKNRLLQDKELKRLARAHQELIKDLQLASAEGDKVQKTLKTALKQDIDALQRKLTVQCNEQSLDAMKRCLETSIMFS